MKYLNKSIDTRNEAETDPEKEHMRGLWEALRHEPCSPTCNNWLRYGIQPKNAKVGPAPGLLPRQGTGTSPSASAAAAS